MSYFVHDGEMDQEVILDIFGEEVLDRLIKCDDEITDEYIIENVLDYACPIKLAQYDFIELININKIKYKKTLLTIVHHNPELLDHYVYNEALVKLEEYRR